MSSFLTKVPVNLEGALKLLPKQSIVEGVEWDGFDLLVRWSNHQLETPFTYHFPFPLDTLAAQRLPDQVAERKLKPKPQPAAAVMTRAPVSVAKPARRPAKSPPRR